MRRIYVLPVLLLLAFSLSACYHTQIMTGKAPSNKVIQKDWVTGFVYGLAMPDMTDVSEECPNGVAKVETLHSFLNQVATIATFSLYTPMTIIVTCAEPVSSADVQMIRGANAQRVLTTAVARSRAQQRPVYVQLYSSD